MGKRKNTSDVSAEEKELTQGMNYAKVSKVDHGEEIFLDPKFVEKLRKFLSIVEVTMYDRTTRRLVLRDTEGVDYAVEDFWPIAENGDPDETWDKDKIHYYMKTTKDGKYNYVVARLVD